MEEIERVEKEAVEQIQKASSWEDLEKVRIRYLGRKSILNQLFSRLPTLEKEERARLGRRLNAFKEKLTKLIEDKQNVFRQKEELIDLTFPARKIERGSKHILTIVTEKICRIFKELGFEIIEGNEIEDEWHNFTALNIPLEHPSRDVFDTFYLDLEAKKDKGKYLLRSHTSPSQIRVMEKLKPPLAVISPGRVYRPDNPDASHSFMFHQIEGFWVDEDINFSHLKGVLLFFAQRFFSPDVKLRFRPHHFPFTEPSAEVDISCMICKGETNSEKKCSVCKGKGWLEILGCGMIHPQVLKNCGINPKKYQGFAFGMGVERIAMLKYGIDDIRLFYENDIRFLEQFHEI